MRPSGCVAGSPIFDAITENSDVMRARTFPWKVALKLRVSGPEEDVGLGTSTGKCSVVDSLDESSRIRTFILAWSSVYGRAYETVPAMNWELPSKGDGLVGLLDGAGGTPSCDGAFEPEPGPEPEPTLLGGVSGVNETPDWRMSSSLIRISDCPLRRL
jgi:hypothetical protein